MAFGGEAQFQLGEEGDALLETWLLGGDAMFVRLFRGPRWNEVFPRMKNVPSLFLSRERKKFVSKNDSVERRILSMERMVEVKDIIFLSLPIFFKILNISCRLVKFIAATRREQSVLLKILFNLRLLYSNIANVCHPYPCIVLLRNTRISYHCMYRYQSKLAAHRGRARVSAMC